MKGLQGKIIGVLLTVIGALLSWALVEILDFKQDWETDEAIEELQDKPLMFDSVEQKAETLHVVDEVDPVEMKVKIQRDIDFQKQVLKKLSHMDSVSNLNADQIYQIKEEFKRNH